ARQLIASLEAAFDPSKYHDEYRARVLDLIERKAQGDEIAIAPAPEEQAAPLPDLMSALKASLDAVRAERPEAPAPKPARRRSTAAKKPAAGGRAAKKPAAKKPRA
ncbi:MAG: Ku protein, partial [Solirubrobacteraceae bacterium]|nr:Ku protein [Solirubrobacteraceae bacterium]